MNKAIPSLVFLFLSCLLCVGLTLPTVPEAAIAKGALAFENTEQDMYINPFIPKLPEKKPEEVVPEIVEPPTTTPSVVVPPTGQPVGIGQPPTPTAIEPPELTINGLIWNSDLPQAIVNNEIVQLGDTVAEATIVGIHREGIDVTYQGVEFTINKDSSKPEDENE